MEIYKVNPELFRDLSYMCCVTPDVLNPRSEDLERAYNLETFDRMVMHPEMFDQEETARLLLSSNPLTKKDPDKYLPNGGNPMTKMLAGSGITPPQGQGQPQQGQQSQQGAPAQSPLASAMGKTPLPATPSVGQVS